MINNKCIIEAIPLLILSQWEYNYVFLRVSIIVLILKTSIKARHKKSENKEVKINENRLTTYAFEIIKKSEFPYKYITKLLLYKMLNMDKITLYDMIIKILCK